MSQPLQSPATLVRRLSPGAALALLTFGVHILTTLLGGYGYFRDEFYYIACSDRLAWGYVDHPPLSILLLRVMRAVGGDSLFAIRLLPALAAAGTVYLAGIVARHLGGNSGAQALASLATAIAPVYLAVSSFYSMNALEPLFWVGAASMVITIVNGGDRTLWLGVGVIAGLGLQNKLGMLFFGFALVVGVLLTSHRKLFATPWPWLGAGIAALLFLPNVLWQAANDWPTLEFMRNAQQWKNAPMSPGDFLSAQILFQHPITLPLWLAGLAGFLFSPTLKKYRFIGIAYLVLLILFVAQRGKPYYLSPIYPLLLAGGAVLLEQIGRGRRWRWLPRAYGTVSVLAGLATLPIWLPLLHPETYIRYSSALGLAPPKMERHHDSALPQVFADRFGWEEMVSTVATVYNSLPPEERSKTAIYAQNYGEAGAIDFLGRKHGLPPAISGHNNYWLWGTYDHTGEILIAIGGTIEAHRAVYDSVQVAAVHSHPYAMPFETDLSVFVCRQPRVPLQRAWERVRRYI